jgi:hypothetical protein
MSSAAWNYNESCPPHNEKEPNSARMNQLPWPTGRQKHNRRNVLINIQEDVQNREQNRIARLQPNAASNEKR